jgi:feruloyl esterase
MRRAFILIAATLVSSTAAAQSPGRGSTDRRQFDDASRCRTLANTRVGESQILSADFIQPPYRSPSMTFTAATTTVPVCRIVGEIAGEGNASIGFELWLPLGQSWNQKLLVSGSGGFAGSIAYAAIVDGVERGYAALATDNGHVVRHSRDARWAYRHPERLKNFGHGGLARSTLASKQIVAKHFGRPPRLSYYQGCSAGGGRGLMMARRYPDLFDGVIAGAAVASWSRELSAQAWWAKATVRSGQSVLPAGKVEILRQAVAKACAGPDGVIADPRSCRFDPTILRCKQGDGADCLTDVQVDAVRKLYGGPRLASGERIYPGLALGSEFLWHPWRTGSTRPDGSWEEFFRYIVWSDPARDPESFSLDRDYAAAVRVAGADLDADDPDLSNYARSGGKLIMYHGWSDEYVPAEASTNYAEAVKRRLGTQTADSFLRLFMIPGMGHCGGRPGPTAVVRYEMPPGFTGRDRLSLLEDWVERGAAPTAMRIAVMDKGVIVSRALVPALDR